MAASGSVLKWIAREFGRVMPSYQPGVRLTDLAEPGNESLPPELIVIVG